MPVELPEVILVCLFLPNVTTIIVIAFFYVLKSRKICSCKKNSDKDLSSETKGSFPVSETRLSDLQHAYSRSNSERTSNRSETRLLKSSHKENIQVRDAVANWCDVHSLTQATAEALRELGFHNKEELEAIDHRTVEQLNVTQAQKCLLRKIVFNELNEDFNQRHGSYNGYKGRDVSVNSSSNAGLSFERSLSGDEKESSFPLLDNKHGKIFKPREFRGYLSDTGLYNLAESIGESWRKLAIKLSISASDQSDVRRNTSLADGIARMLRKWRDNQVGTDENIQKKLCQALNFSDRKDLADIISAPTLKNRDGKLFSKV